MWVFRKALKSQLHLFWVIKARIRLLIPEAKSEGYDKHVDDVIHLAAHMLTSPELFEPEIPQYVFEGFEGGGLEEQRVEMAALYDKLRAEYRGIRPEVDKLVNRVRDDKIIQEALKGYLLVRHYSDAQRDNKGFAEQHITRAKEIDPAVTPLNHDDIRRISKSANMQLRVLRNEIADKEAAKLSLTESNLATLITLFSSMFLVTGYIYNRFFLGAFDIDVSRYFTLTDYLASSIEGVRYAAVGACVGLVSVFMGYHHGSRKSYAQLEFERTKKDYSPYIFAVGGAGWILTGYLKEIPYMFETGVGMVAIFLIFEIGARATRKYFKEATLALFALIFIGTFSVYLYWSIAHKIDHYRHEEIADIKTSTYRFTEDVGITDECLVLLASNSHYFFFRDMRDDISVIVPTEKIVSVRTIDKTKIQKTDSEDIEDESW